jgi:hypothetical protein
VVFENGSDAVVFKTNFFQLSGYAHLVYSSLIPPANGDSESAKPPA